MAFCPFYKGEQKDEMISCKNCLISKFDEENDEYRCVFSVIADNLNKISENIDQISYDIYDNQ